MNPQLKLSTSELDESEEVILVSRISEEIAKTGKNSDPTLLEHRESVEKAAAQLAAAISRSFASAHSASIRENDTQRTDVRNIIKQVVSALSKKANVEISSAAKRVLASHEKAFAGYNLENNAIESERTIVFLTDLAQPDLAKDIQTLDLVDEVKLLDVSNREYERLTKLRALEPLEDTGLRLRPSRRELKIYLDHLESHILFKARRGSDNHIILAEELQKIVSELISTAKSRETRKENTKEKEKTKDLAQDDIITE